MTPPVLTTNTDWMHQFEPNSTFHLVSVAGCLLYVAVCAALGRWWRDRPEARSLDLFLGWSLIFVQLYAFAWRWLPDNFELHEALPLQLCRIVSWICAIALITRAQWAIGIAFFWGFGLSTMGFFTPVIRTGLASPEYWLFWMAHAQIVGTSVYFIVVDGWTPRRRDWVIGLLVSLAYVLFIVPVNLLLRTDYGFLGAGHSIAYDKSTLAGHLGEFPLRALWILLLAEVWLTFLFLMARLVQLIKRARKRAVPA